MVEVPKAEAIVPMANVLNMVVGLVLVAGMYLPKTQVLAEVPFMAQAVGVVVAVLKQPKSVDVEALGVCMPLVVVVPLELLLLVGVPLVLAAREMKIFLDVATEEGAVAPIVPVEMAAWGAQVASQVAAEVEEAARKQARAAHLEWAAMES